MKIFITGIAGFIGYHLAQELRAFGHTVLGCDNFNGY
jgi:UDP-glucuronate 4-epimerase